MIGISDTNPEKDWPEDFPHENGMYYCRCVHCKDRFIGYKRRVVCRKCDTNIKAGAMVNSDGGYSIGTQVKYEEFVKLRNGTMTAMEKLMYDSGLTAQGCWDQMDSYDKEAIMKFAELIVKQCMSKCDETKADYTKYRKASSDFMDKNLYAEGEAVSDLIKYHIKKILDTK